MAYLGYAWLGIVVVSVIIEALTMGLTTIWFAIGAIVAFLVNLTGIGIEVQIVAFLLVSILCLLFTRPFAMKKLKVGRIRTNTDLLIGQQCKVESTIDNLNNQGTVNVKGQIWTARSVDDQVIEKGEIVTIKEIIGVKLIVEKK
ncbi:MAG TPA: NfeD family protein [Tissierellia bacterium]|jgi:membrane protein implicated in regulation of membrane protease activity|nr:NfeD family protein [Tissierellia bacterium]